MDKADLNDSRERARARRHRQAGVMLAVGVVLLFMATWAFPEGVIHVARATAGEDATPLSARGWFTAIVGPVALVLSGVSLFWGFWLRQRHTKAVSDEDRAVDDAWGAATLTEYDPTAYR